MIHRLLTAALLLPVVLANPLAPAAFAQSGGLTLAQVEQKYRTMSPVHILKCDYDGNQIFTRTEMLCVSGIYQQMYVDRD